MTNEQIKILLNKYFEGETSLEEEALLSAYFNGNNVEDALKQYQPLFQFFKAEKNITLSESTTSKILAVSKGQNYSKIEDNNARRLSILRGGMWWKAAAAIVILGVGSFFLIDKLYKKQPNQTLVENHRITIYDEYDDPEKAFAEVQAALRKVSKKMKKGNEETLHGLGKIKKASKELDKIIPKNEL